MALAMRGSINELFVNDFVAYGGNKYSKTLLLTKRKEDDRDGSYQFSESS